MASNEALAADSRTLHIDAIAVPKEAKPGDSINLKISYENAGSAGLRIDIFYDPNDVTLPVKANNDGEFEDYIYDNTYSNRYSNVSSCTHRENPEGNGKNRIRIVWQDRLDVPQGKRTVNQSAVPYRRRSFRFS